MKKEELKLKAPKYNDEIELFIEGDENDADYVNTTSFISLEDFGRVLPLIKKIKKARNSKDPHFHNWENKEDYLTEAEVEELYNTLNIPSGANDPVHSITEFEAWFLSKDDGIRYEVKF